MTQLLAAECDGGAAVVTASERVIGVPGEIPVYEQAWSKQLEVAPGILALFSGESLRYWGIVEGAKRKFGGARGSAVPIQEIVENIRADHEKHRIRHAEQMLLKHVLNISTFEEWRRLKNVVAKPLMEHVVELLRCHFIDARVLVVGVVRGDGGPGAQLWQVTDDSRTAEVPAQKSYVCAGSGSPLAEALLGMWGHSKECSVEATKRVVYEAIRIAMASQGSASGVVDMYLIDADGTHKLSDAEVNGFGSSFGPAQRTRG